MMICGVGIKDINLTKDHANYKLYEAWHSMLKRCYGRLANKFNPSYANTRVCDAWLTFSLFYEWALDKGWEGKELDKDLLGDGSIYSPDACCFISGSRNRLQRKEDGNFADVGRKRK